MCKKNILVSVPAFLCCPVHPNAQEGAKEGSSGPCSVHGPFLFELQFLVRCWQVRRPLWKITSHTNISYEDRDMVEPPEDKPESLPLYTPWFSPSPPREDGEDEEAGDDEEVL